MKKRYYGLDIAKGISVLGMILSHSFMGTAAKWKSSILFSLVAKIPTGLLYTLMIPICLFSQMGSLFSLISAVCVTLSFMEISKKGFRVVWRYILMKMVFGFLLRGISADVQHKGVGGSVVRVIHADAQLGIVQPVGGQFFVRDLVGHIVGEIQIAVECSVSKRAIAYWS